MSETTTDCERLDWQYAKVHNKIVNGAVLVVRGETPVPMQVELRPRPIGIAPEDYRGVELCGTRTGPGPEVVTPFEITEDVSELPHGRIGFVLIGATMRLFVPPKED